MYCLQVVMQLLQRLLEHEKGSLEGKWGDLVTEVIAAIDGEKDPRCLLLSFRIVELLAQVCRSFRLQIVTFIRHHC